MIDPREPAPEPAEEPLPAADVDIAELRRWLGVDPRKWARAAAAYVIGVRPDGTQAFPGAGMVSADPVGDLTRWFVAAFEAAKLEADTATLAQVGLTLDTRPHSRACGWRAHPHGSGCSADCPTCHGRVDGAARQMVPEGLADRIRAHRQRDIGADDYPWDADEVYRHQNANAYLDPDQAADEKAALQEKVNTRPAGAMMTGEPPFPERAGQAFIR